MWTTIPRRLAAMAGARAAGMAGMAAMAVAALSGCSGAAEAVLVDTRVPYELSQHDAGCKVAEPLADCQGVRILAAKRHDGTNELRPLWSEKKDTPGAPSVVTSVARDLQPNGDVQLTVNFGTRVQPGVYTGTIEISILSFDPFTDWQPNRIRYRLEVGSGDPAHLTVLPAAIPGRGAWSGFGGDGTRAGHAAVSLDPAKFTSRWTRWIATPADFSGDGMNLGQGRIAVTDAKVDDKGAPASNASVIDLQDGRTLWSTLLPELPTQVIANGDRLYWSTRTGRVMATAATVGAVLAEHTGKGNTFADPGWTFAGTRLLMPVDPEVNYLSALDVADLRTPVWTATLADRLANRNYRAWGPTVDGAAGLVYVNAGGMYRVLRASDGGIVAQAQVPTREDQVFAQIATYQAPVLADDGLSAILLSHREMDPGSAVPNHLTVVDRATGAQRWDASGQFMDHPVTARGVVYAANQLTKSVEARSVADGTLLWTWPMEAGDGHWQRQMVLTDSHLFVSTDRQTVALDLATRQVVWRVAGGGWLGLTPEGVLVMLSQSRATQGFSMLRTFNLR
jgi:hypothetical protein